MTGVVDVVLPVLNEVGAIRWVLERMPDQCRPIVVDNGSSDGSAELASSLGARVVHAAERGFGAACHAGLMAADADLVAFMDCDATLDPAELPRLVALVHDGTADLVLGAREAERGAWPIPARVANRALSIVLRRRGIALSDLGPMRVANRSAIIDLGIADRGTGWPLEMVLRADAQGWTIAEVPVRYLNRIGDSKVTGSIGGCVRVARQMRATLRDVPASRPLRP